MQDTMLCHPILPALERECECSSRKDALPLPCVYLHVPNLQTETHLESTTDSVDVIVDPYKRSLQKAPIQQHQCPIWGLR